MNYLNLGGMGGFIKLSTWLYTSICHKGKAFVPHTKYVHKKLFGGTERVQKELGIRYLVL